MGKIMEAVFCVLYIISVIVIGTLTVKKADKKKEYVLLGIMALVLVFGDAFHLVPRIIVAIDPVGDYKAALGIGKLITSITMTLFYLFMYYIYTIRYEYRNKVLTVSMIVLAVLRIALCLFPQNDWTGEAPVIWGIYRNIPFLIMGIVMIVLFFMKRSDKPFRFMWLAITLSYAFYIPVVLWADVSPIIGMLMMPKTVMYVWAVVMGYNASRKKL